MPTTLNGSVLYIPALSLNLSHYFCSNQTSSKKVSNFLSQKVCATLSFCGDHARVRTSVIFYGSEVFSWKPSIVWFPEITLLRLGVVYMCWGNGIPPDGKPEQAEVWEILFVRNFWGVNLRSVDCVVKWYDTLNVHVISLGPWPMFVNSFLCTSSHPLNSMPDLRHRKIAVHENFLRTFSESFPNLVLPIKHLFVRMCCFLHIYFLGNVHLFTRFFHKEWTKQNYPRDSRTENNNKGYHSLLIPSHRQLITCV